MERQTIPEGRALQNEKKNWPILSKSNIIGGGVKDVGKKR